MTQKAYRGITPSDIHYLNLTRHEMEIARGGYRPKQYPSIPEVQRAIEAIPKEGEIQRRDRALLAFTLLSGMRDGAIVGLRLKHLNLSARTIKQDSREMKSKFRKHNLIVFFPVGEIFEAELREYVSFLHSKGFAQEDSLFPEVSLNQGESFQFRRDTLSKRPHQSASMVRRVFKEAFLRVGLHPFHPHSFRDALMALAKERNLGIAEMEAWSRNLGHAHLNTTLLHYGQSPEAKRVEVMRGLLI